MDKVCWNTGCLRGIRVIAISPYAKAALGIHNLTDFAWHPHMRRICIYPYFSIFPTIPIHWKRQKYVIVKLLSVLQHHRTRPSKRIHAGELIALHTPPSLRFHVELFNRTSMHIPNTTWNRITQPINNFTPVCNSKTLWVPYWETGLSAKTIYHIHTYIHIHIGQPVLPSGLLNNLDPLAHEWILRMKILYLGLR